MRRLSLMVLGTTLITAALSISGCKTLKPYEKEYLLHPLMDEASLTQLQEEMPGVARSRYERLSSASGGSGATSCPTCGG